jgi:hypothetical protein
MQIPIVGVPRMSDMAGPARLVDRADAPGRTLQATRP